ncbi:deoxyguanosinetriphosphate triphosphohydrolase [Methyloligella sp. GL2]|uniref:deoxyguanosinetriphosphate triphosphohydrolase n=1 Tax=unclassified Methyloligella TaxID=2625955 RepID=UPI00157DAD00|nr:deoxyguanosinetriphosphate triphosphohydrolase [Methyloligella sp. GL2]QKP78809.1 deoxyguanosinetriphosphate triphosphohydrolase [Methyloligella sp. GL2]
MPQESALYSGPAPYAADASESRGRLVPEPMSPHRSPFQRDRDRIVHASAFRRLTHKTQVFIYHEGDHYRTRLTHSLEVAQIARTMARSLALDEDLTEAVALAHDLGHSPFGHSGERALHRAMQGAGGFDHNAQSLRVVTELERKYAEFDGLNLTWEALEGLVKHNGPMLDLAAIPGPITGYNAKHDLELATYASLEAQLAALSDDIAYNNHDVEDGYRFGCFAFEELGEVPLVGDILAELQLRYPGLEASRMLNELNRRLITRMIEDARSETMRRIEFLAPADSAAIRHAPMATAAFSERMVAELQVLRDFLKQRVYRHKRVMAIMGDAEQVVSDLFDLYNRNPKALPPNWSDQAPEEGSPAYARHICDFIAGMTDRYALAEHRRLFDVTPDLR